jgi:hypothetical protein
MLSEQLKARAVELDKYLKGDIWDLMSDEEKAPFATNVFTSADSKGRKVIDASKARLRLWLNGEITLDSVKQLWKLFSLISANEEYSNRWYGHADLRNLSAVNSLLPFLRKNMPREELLEFVKRFNIGRKQLNVDDPLDLEALR